MAASPFILFGVVFAAVVAWTFARRRAEAAARTRVLATLGFVPARGDAGSLAAEVARDQHNGEYRYRVLEPMKASVAGRPVWCYVKERTRQGSTVSAYELRAPLRRPSADGLVLFYKPTALAPGTTVTQQGSLATDGFDAQPDDLTRLEVPVERRAGNVIGVLGPARRSLYDLIDAEALGLLEPVGDYGVVVVTCRGDWCSLASSTTRTTFDLVHLWPIVRQLAAL